MKKLYFHKLSICPYCKNRLVVVDKYGKYYSLKRVKQMNNDEFDRIEFHHIECVNCHEKFTLNWALGKENLQVLHDERMGI